MMDKLQFVGLSEKASPQGEGLGVCSIYLIN